MLDKRRVFQNWGGMASFSHVRPETESWSAEASEERPQQPQRDSARAPGPDFPIPGSRPAVLPALGVPGTSRHPAQISPLASAGLSRQLLLASTSPLRWGSWRCRALARMPRGS